MNIIGIRFKSAGKVYYFDPCDTECKKGDMVVVTTSRGTECGEVVIANKQIDEKEFKAKLKPIVRVATEEDLQTLEKNKQREQQAFKICEEKIAAHKLNMKLVDVECTLDNSKMLFYFTAENRVDFRALVKDLAFIFRTRIELRQIGIRDQAKMIGGLGVCGRPYCCSEFLGDFQPVSVKMAKEQGLSLNPTKISGACGRLMCCLKYEQDGYDELLKVTPKVGATVKTAEGKGTVVEVNLLTGRLSVKIDKSDAIISCLKDDVKVIRDSHIKISKEEKELKKLEE